MRFPKKIFKILLVAYGVVIALFLIIPEDSADEHCVKGGHYVRKGQYEQAISEFTRAIKIEPRDIQAYRYRGAAYVEKGDLDKAIGDYTTAIKKNPRYALYALLLIDRGNAYRAKGEYDLAISDYTKAIEMHAKYSKAYINRAAIYYMKGQYDRAWEDVHKAEESGHQVPVEFLAKLRKASGRDN